MTYRKNVKRIDPRYFLNETVNRGEEPDTIGEAWGSPYDPKGPVHQVDPRVTSAEDDPWGPETKKKEPGVGGQPPEWERKLAKSEPKVARSKRRHVRRLEDPDVDVEELEEEQGIFAPNHYCVHHGAVQHEGQIKMAEAINHNFDRKLNRVTHYDMKLQDGTILEGIATEDIQVVRASLAEEHSHGEDCPSEDEEDAGKEK